MLGIQADYTPGGLLGWGDKQQMGHVALVVYSDFSPKGLELVQPLCPRDDYSCST